MKESIRTSTRAASAGGLLGLGVGLLLAGAAVAGPIPEISTGLSDGSGAQSYGFGPPPFRYGWHRSKTPKQGTPGAGGGDPCQGASAPSTSTEDNGGSRTLRSKFHISPRRGNGGSSNVSNAGNGGATGSGGCAGGGSTNGGADGNTSPDDNAPPSGNTPPDGSTPPNGNTPPGHDDSSGDESGSSNPPGVGGGDNDESDPFDGGEVGEDDPDPLIHPEIGGNEGGSGPDPEIPGPPDFVGDLGLPGEGSPDYPGPTFDVIVTNGATPEAVPEPGSLALIGLGLAGLAAYRRRKR